MGRLAAELIGGISKETVILNLEYSLALLRNPRRQAWVSVPNEAELAQVPGRSEALNKAQGAGSPFDAGELLFIMATLIRGLARARAERPGSLGPAGIETLFRLLSGEGVTKPPGKPPGKRASGRRRR